ncbi:MAG: DUF2868 domain-containing protein [Burkholderiales bacterium]|nr:DUF2868 domain-containing protein [Burkholderiales bacterium]
MTEDDARCALLVRACETAAPGQVQGSDADRAWASRAAAEVVGERASADTFIARRAQLAAERLGARDASLRRALRAVRWRPWVGWLLVLLAFAAGIAGDAIGAGQRINVLAPPLLALLAWNLCVYLFIALNGAARLLGWRLPGDQRGRPLSRLLARAAHAIAAPAASAVPGPSTAARFALDWAHAAARLNTLRVARMLHLAAFALAAGALAGLYLRGLVLEYRAGWESTFLGANSVSALLAAVLGPAAQLTGIALPDAARLEAMRFPGSGGEPAAPWIHLYAVTVAAAILLPRLLLALIDGACERRLARSFPLPSSDPYFASLARMHRGESATILVVPYNHRPSPQASIALHDLLGAVYGPSMQLTVAAAVNYGDEQAAQHARDTAGAGDAPPSLLIVLFSSTATPEADAQGAFLDALAQSSGGTAPMLVTVDESAFVARFGNTDATAQRRRGERRQSWQKWLAARDLQPWFIDLERVETATASRELAGIIQAQTQAHSLPERERGA